MREIPDVQQVPGEPRRRWFFSHEQDLIVWFGEDGDRLFVFTAGDSGKVKRLRNSPRARIAACDARGKVHGPWHDAQARVITDPALIARANERLLAKYGWQLRLLDLFSRLSGRYAKRAYLEIRA